MASGNLKAFFRAPAHPHDRVCALSDHALTRFAANECAHPAPPAGVTSAGVVLELRKRGVRVAVEGDVDFVFSAPPSGDEDARFALADPATPAALGPSVREVARSGDAVVVTPSRSLFRFAPGPSVPGSGLEVS